VYNRKNRKGPYVRGPMIIDVHAYLLDSFYTAINHFYHIYVPLDRIWCFHRILVIVNKSLEFTSFLYVFDRVLVHWEEDWKLPLLESSPSEMWSPSEEARRERPRGSSGMKEDSAMSLEELAQSSAWPSRSHWVKKLELNWGLLKNSPSQSSLLSGDFWNSRRAHPASNALSEVTRQRLLAQYKNHILLGSTEHCFRALCGQKHHSIDLSSIFSFFPLIFSCNLRFVCLSCQWEANFPIVRGLVC